MSLKLKLIDMFKGAAIAVTASLPIALLFAMLFRLPVPLGGMVGPFGELSLFEMGAIEALKAVLVAWVFYGALGGFIVLAASGAVTALIISCKDPRTGCVAGKNKTIALWSTIVAVPPILLLAVLDYIIGPW